MIERIHYLGIPHSFSIQDGFMYKDGKLITQVPRKEYDSYDDYISELAEAIKNRKGDIYIEHPEDFKRLYLKQKYMKDAVYQIAKFLIRKYQIKTTDEKVREIYVYRNGIYISGTNIIGAEVQKILEEQSNNQNKKEIVEKIKDLTLISRNDFIVSENLINLENGVYDLDKGTLSDHNPNNLFLAQIPVRYDPKADCPKIKSVLAELLESDQITILQEWVGYILYREYFIKKAIIFVGEPNTGKTTIISLLTKFIGEANISGASLHSISVDKFISSQLYAKHLNIYDDLSTKDITDNGKFKIATGNGYIGAEYKYGNRFDFRNYAKLTFACNQIPSVAETSDDAYFSRWIIVPFNKKVNTPNPFLLKELTIDTELSGFLNFALRGLERLMKNQSFSFDKKPDKVKAEMMKYGSVIANFAYDQLESGDYTDWVSKDRMYKIFADFAKHQGKPIASIQEFGRKIKRYADYMSDSKEGGDTGWRNVRFKSENKDQDNQGLIAESISAIEDPFNFEGI